MFGGLAFLVNGNMSVGASGQGGILVRVPPDDTETLLEGEHVEPMVMRGRELRGWLRVDAEGVRGSVSSRPGSNAACPFARSLAPK